MAENDDQERVVEQDGEQPEKLAGAVDELGALMHLRLGVAEQGAEQKNLQDHPGDDPELGGGAVDLVLLDPGQGVGLTTGGRNPEGNGRFGPLHDAIGKPSQEEGKGEIGQDDPYQCLPTRHLGGHQANRDKRQNCDEWSQDSHVLLPRIMFRSRYGITCVVNLLF